MHHIQVAITRNHLGTLYAAQGKQYFIQAEKQFLLALEIKEKTFGKVRIDRVPYLPTYQIESNVRFLLLYCIVFSPGGFLFGRYSIVLYEIWRIRTHPKMSYEIA